VELVEPLYFDGDGRRLEADERGRHAT
jgi:hypothetical protein